MITRRNFITGLATLLAAPAIVRVGSLMQLRSTPVSLVLHGDISVYAEWGIDLSPGAINYADVMASSIFYGNDALDPASFRGIKFHRNQVLGRSPAMAALPDIRALPSA